MTAPPAAVRLSVRPMTFPAACAFVQDHHRHHGPPRGHKFSLGVLTEHGRLVGVAIIGRPVARLLDDGLTVEVTRLATDGTPNACSALYGAAWRTARAAGYRRAITYTQAGESGASLRGAGWRKAAERSPRTSWDTPSRRRTGTGTQQVARTLWEITTHNAPPVGDETRYETPRVPQCKQCGNRITTASTGRPPRYCSPACRQRAYRRRLEDPS